MKNSPIVQLTLARLREFFREPKRFLGLWVSDRPGRVAWHRIREQPIERVVVDVQEGPHAETALAAFKAIEKFDARKCDEVECRNRLRTGKTQLVVVPGSEGDSRIRLPLRSRPQRQRSRAQGN